ncbi:MAG: isoprenyl transferase [Clostridia bacterium]|nr:isoprenyl transferase [Clostridia bacterium]
MEEEKKMPSHIAIIMDGNRRWAKERNLDPKLGHKAGAETLEKIAKYANQIGIQYLTVYAFSTENWKRAKEEVGALMFLLKSYLEDFLSRTSLDNIKLNILGDVSKLDGGLQKSIYKLMEKTKNNTGLTLNIAFNYGGRDEIIKATQKIARKVQDGEIAIDDINEELFSEHLYTAGQPDPDLLIRPGGEERISNYLLWQLAYTEFLFIPKYWPDFSEQDLDQAIDIFRQRNRKFGAK